MNHFCSVLVCFAIHTLQEATPSIHGQSNSTQTASDLSYRKQDSFHAILKRFSCANTHGVSLFSFQPRLRSRQQIFKQPPQRQCHTKARRNLSDPDYRRAELEKIGSLSGVTSLEDWYRISFKEIRKSHPHIKSLLSHHGDSLMRGLCELYPTHSWDALRFSPKPRNFWQDPNNLKLLFESFERENALKDKEGWYKLSLSQIKKMKPDIKLALDHKSCSSLYQALTTIFPEHTWDATKVQNFCSHPTVPNVS